LPSVLFDFNTAAPSLTNTEVLPLTQSSGGIVAQFTSPQGSAFSVQDDPSIGWTLPKFVGHYLFPRLSGSTLEIQFSQPLSSIALSFGTLDFQDVVTPSTLQLTAYLDSTNSTPVGTAAALGLYKAGDALPMGSLISPLTASPPAGSVRPRCLAARTNSP
jgi:hypothetical protein